MKNLPIKILEKNQLESSGIEQLGEENKVKILKAHKTWGRNRFML